jgi:3-dehydroquinate dehydratase-2
MEKKQFLVISGPVTRPSVTLESNLRLEHWLNDMNDIDVSLQQAASALGVSVTYQNCSSTATLVEGLRQAASQFDGVLINTGELAEQDSESLCNDLQSLEVPCIEVFVDHAASEACHRYSIVASACVGVIGGFGNNSYLLALEALVNLVSE